MSAGRAALSVLKWVLSKTQKAIVALSIIIKNFMKWWAAKAPGIFYSFWLHFVLIVLLVGLPVSCNKEPPKHSVISVELLPVKDKTNVKPKPKKTGDKPKEKPKVKKEPPKPKPVPKKAAPEPKPKAIPAPKPKIKPKPKAKPKPPKPKEEPLDFDTVLKSVEKLKEKNKDKENDKDKDKLNFPKDLNYEPSAPLSLSEIDSIKRQISQCWSIPAGARDALDITVTLKIYLRRDGSLTKVDIVDKSRYSNPDEGFFKAAADAAIRAIRQCSPLKGLPPQKYNSWKEIEMNFDPREMLY